jgi:hypothetical protein
VRLTQIKTPPDGVLRGFDFIAYLLVTLLLCHSAADGPNDRHQDATANATADHLSQNVHRIHRSARHSRMEHLLENLASNSAANDAGDRIADCPKAQVLEHAAGDISAESTADELD